MNRDKLKALYLKYELTAEDIFTKDIGNSSFTIITRQGIDKIQGIEKIDTYYRHLIQSTTPWDTGWSLQSLMSAKKP